MAPKTIIGRHGTSSAMKPIVGRNRFCVRRATSAGTISLLQTQTVRERHNMAVNLAPFGRWTLRHKAAQRRLPLRYAS